MCIRDSLCAQRRGRPKEQGGDQNADRVAIAQVDDRQRNKATPGRHVGLEEAQVAHAQVEATERSAETTRHQRPITHPANIDARGLGGVRRLACGCLLYTSRCV